jgi:integrase
MNHDYTQRLDRHASARIVRRLTKAAGIDKRISPHSLGHSFITAVFSSSVVVAVCLRDGCVMHVGDALASYRHRRGGLFLGGSG